MFGGVCVSSRRVPVAGTAPSVIFGEVQFQPPRGVAPDPMWKIAYVPGRGPSRPERGQGIAFAAIVVPGSNRVCAAQHSV